MDDVTGKATGRVTRKFFSVAILLAGMLSTAPRAAEDGFSFGAGLGALYNGVGVNLGLMSETDFKYAALGCISLGYSSSHGTLSNCGIGVGWMKSNLLSESGRHGIGIHLGITYNTHNTHENQDEIEVFIGIPYVYFFNDMNNAGLNLGLTPYFSRDNDENHTGFLLNLGYQF